MTIGGFTDRRADVGHLVVVEIEGQTSYFSSAYLNTPATDYKLLAHLTAQNLGA